MLKRMTIERQTRFQTRRVESRIARVVAACALAIIFLSASAASAFDANAFDANALDTNTLNARRAEMPRARWAVQSHYVMGTMLEVQAPSDEDSGDPFFASLFDIARRQDEIFSTFKPESPVSRFNQSGRKGASIDAPDELIELVEISQRLAVQTDGAFDITVGPLVRLWKEAATRQRWPQPEEISEARNHTGAAKVRLDARARTITALDDCLEIDFSGIAKGYCVDKMIDACRKAGIDQAFINFGESSVYALGKGLDAQGWSVAVRDPRHPDRAALTLRLSDMAIGSSGSYERSSRIGKRAVNHIIDPRTGMPATIDIAVTVVAASATLADALSTALVVLPPDEGLEVLEKFPGAEAVIFYRSREGRWQRLLSRGMNRFIESPGAKFHSERNHLL